MTTLKKVSIEAKQVDGFKIETRMGNHIALVDQPKAGGGTNFRPQPPGLSFRIAGWLYCHHWTHHRQAAQFTGTWHPGQCGRRAGPGYPDG